MPAMRLALVFVLAVVLLGAHRTAEACSCLRPEGPREELLKFAAVFEGRVVTVTPGDGGFDVALEVARAWKGVATPTVTVATAESSAACGFAFAEGESYLLYADEIEGRLAVTICSRSREIAGAGEDLEAFGAPSYLPGATATPAPAPDPAPVSPGEPIPIEPPPPPPPPKSGGCAGCSATPASEPSFFAILLLALPLLRRRVVS
jgi:MYXO-CTERM domain-containing protein